MFAYTLCQRKPGLLFYRLEGCQVCADLTSKPLPIERLAESKLGTPKKKQF